MDFRLTKLKGIILVIIIVLWFIFINLIYPSHISCKTCQYIDINTCPKVFVFELIPPICNCGCPSQTNFSDIISDLIILLIPSILVYLIWSFIQKKNS